MPRRLVSFDDAEHCEHLSCRAIERPTLDSAPRDQRFHLDLYLFNRVTFGNEVIKTGGVDPLEILERVMEVVLISGGLAQLRPTLLGEPWNQDCAEDARVQSGKFLQPLFVPLRNSSISSSPEVSSIGKAESRARFQ